MKDYTNLNNLMIKRGSNHDDEANCRFNLNVKKILRLARKFFALKIENDYHAKRNHMRFLRTKDPFNAKSYLEYTDKLVAKVFDQKLFQILGVTAEDVSNHLAGLISSPIFANEFSRITD